MLYCTMLKLHNTCQSVYVCVCVCVCVCACVVCAGLSCLSILLLFLQLRLFWERCKFRKPFLCLFPLHQTRNRCRHRQSELSSLARWWFGWNFALWEMFRRRKDNFTITVLFPYFLVLHKCLLRPWFHSLSRLIQRDLVLPDSLCWLTSNRAHALPNYIFWSCFFS